jgi:hypothetical protein
VCAPHGRTCLECMGGCRALRARFGALVISQNCIIADLMRAHTERCHNAYMHRVGEFKAKDFLETPPPPPSSLLDLT